MTATFQPATDLRDCHLYRFWVRHPLTRVRVLGYVGETVRLPFERLMEHIYSQPWADTIIAWEVDDVVYPGKAAVLEAEKFAVETEFPLYNYEWNLANPNRVEIWRAKQQRWARDDQRNRPRWVDSASKTQRSRASDARPRPRNANRGGRRKAAELWTLAVVGLTAWLLLALMTWHVTARLGVAGINQRIWWSLLTPVALGAYGHFLGPLTWMKIKKQIRRWVRGVL